MDLKKLDLAVQAIARKRNELKELDYSNPKYDDLEEELHDLEDVLLDEHGEYLEGVLQQVHDKYCPDTDILLPIAYMAKTYSINAANEYSVGPKDGVYVEVDSLPGKETKLVLIPNPLRIVLNVGNEVQRPVWTAK